MKVVRVAIDVPIEKVFDYLGELAAPGDRVVVPFGARARVGVVLETATASKVAKLKPIEAAPGSYVKIRD